jgi:hypothetical protein
LEHVLANIRKRQNGKYHFCGINFVNRTEDSYVTNPFVFAVLFLFPDLLASMFTITKIPTVATTPASDSETAQPISRFKLKD